MKPPDGWIAKNLIIWNELDTRGFVSRGFDISLPDLRQASDTILEQFSDICRHILHSLSPQVRAQFRWEVNGNYTQELTAYKKYTEEHCEPGSWAELQRNERYERYLAKAKEGKLRREKLTLYLSQRVSVSPPKGARREVLHQHNLNILKQYSEAFEQHRRTIASLLQQIGGSIRTKTDEDLACNYAAFFNPSYLKREGFDALSKFDLARTIQQNWWNCGCQGGKNFGCFYDGYFHNFVILKRRPQRVWQGIMWYLTNLPILDYAITVNLRPLHVSEEKKKEQNALTRLSGDYQAEGRRETLTAIQNREARIDKLVSGAVMPINYDFIVHIWANTEQELISKTRSIEAAFGQMADAQCWTSNISTEATTKNIWLQTWPGWCWGDYTSHQDKGDSSWLCHLLPMSSSFTGHLHGAEALYDGPNDTLVGVKTFVSDTPQLAALIGMSRAGKSAFVTDLLTQTDPYYGYTLIIEEGLTYGIWSQAVGSQPIIIRDDGDLCLNYLDTHGAPLTTEQINMASALVLKLSGAPADEDKRNLRRAQITQYVEKLYSDFAEKWFEEDPSRLEKVARQAMAIQSYKLSAMPAGSTFLTAWSEFQMLSEDERESRLAGYSGDHLSTFVTDPGTERLIRNTAYASFKREEYPIHLELQQLMLMAPFPEHDRDEINQIATLLAPWSEQQLLCGHSTLDLKGRCAHFDLTYIPESNKALKEIAGFLIANYGRQHIITLPRSIRKRVVFEEASRTIGVNGGEELIREFYAQLSKFSTWIISIVQQYNQFKESKIRPIVFGNAKQFFFTRMNDRGDVKDLAKDIDLSGAAQDTISRYPLPEHLEPKNRYSSLTYYHLDAQAPLCGTIQNKVSPEMLYCASSTGADFERRERELRKAPDIVQGILNNA